MNFHQFNLQMSSSLKERLKRTSRYFSSPVASKQLCQEAVPNTSNLPGSSNTEAVATKSHLHLDGQHSVNTMDTNNQPSTKHNLDSTKTCGGIEQLPLNEDAISCQNDKDNQPNPCIETSKTLLKKNECRQIAINSSKSDEKLCATCKQNCKCKENEQTVERSKLSNTNSDCSASLESQDCSESTVDICQTSCISKEYTCMDVGKLKTLKMSLEVTVKEKKDVIRKLKMVKMYRAKVKKKCTLKKKQFEQLVTPLLSHS